MYIYSFICLTIYICIYIYIYIVNFDVGHIIFCKAGLMINSTLVSHTTIKRRRNGLEPLSSALYGAIVAGVTGDTDQELTHKSSEAVVALNLDSLGIDSEGNSKKQKKAPKSKAKAKVKDPGTAVVTVADINGDSSSASAGSTSESSED